MDCWQVCHSCSLLCSIFFLLWFSTVFLYYLPYLHSDILNFSFLIFILFYLYSYYFFQPFFFSLTSRNIFLHLSVHTAINHSAILLFASININDVPRTWVLLQPGTSIELGSGFKWNGMGRWFYQRAPCFLYTMWILRHAIRYLLIGWVI